MESSTASAVLLDTKIASHDRTLLFGVALTSFSALLLELALTRLFSVVLFYHFAFLAISIALLGVGAGGVFAYLYKTRLSRIEIRPLAMTLCFWNALMVVIALEIIIHVPVSLELSWTNFGKLTALYLAAAVPFFFAARQGFVSPESFVFIESAVILAIVVLGGLGTQIGIVLAAVVLIGVPEFFRELQDYRMLAFGIGMVLITVPVFLPLVTNPNGVSLPAGIRIATAGPTTAPPRKSATSIAPLFSLITNWSATTPTCPTSGCVRYPPSDPVQL